MCVIIYAINGFDSIDSGTLKRCWDYSSDGAGVAWQELDGVWTMRKGLMSFDQLMEYGKSIEGNRQCVVHVRLATSGSVSPENTHGFYVDNPFSTSLYGRGGNILFHNGVLDGGDSQYSDTQYFCAKLNTVPEKERKSFIYKHTYGAYSGNKFLYINSAGELSKEGMWDCSDNVLYSTFRPSWRSENACKEFLESQNMEADIYDYIKDYMTVNDAAKVYNVSRSTIFRLIANPKEGVESFLLRIGEKKIRFVSNDGLEACFAYPFKL